jgi:predicted kinase
MKKAISRITLMVGLPGSGKTTWVRGNCGDTFVLSADEIRKQVHGMDFYEPAEQLIWTIRKYIFVNALSQRLDIIVDETNTTIKRRSDIIRMAKEFDYVVDCIYIDTEIETCRKRVTKLNQPKKINVINKMSRYFEIPAENEGIVNIVKITPK